MQIEALTPLDELGVGLRRVRHRIPYEVQALLKLLRDHPSRCLSPMTIKAQMCQIEIREPVLHDVEDRAFLRDKEDVFPRDTSSAIRFAIVWLLPVPGGPLMTPFCPPEDSSNGLLLGGISIEDQELIVRMIAIKLA